MEQIVFQEKLFKECWFYFKAKTKNFAEKKEVLKETEEEIEAILAAKVLILEWVCIHHVETHLRFKTNEHFKWSHNGGKRSKMVQKLKDTSDPQQLK